jgi:hypothetical protein
MGSGDIFCLCALRIFIRSNALPVLCLVMTSPSFSPQSPTYVAMCDSGALDGPVSSHRPAIPVRAAAAEMVGAPDVFLVLATRLDAPSFSMGAFFHATRLNPDRLLASLTIRREPEAHLDMIGHEDWAGCADDVSENVGLLLVHIASICRFTSEMFNRCLPGRFLPVFLARRGLRVFADPAVHLKLYFESVLPLAHNRDCQEIFFVCGALGITRDRMRDAAFFFLVADHDKVPAMDRFRSWVLSNVVSPRHRTGSADMRFMAKLPSHPAVAFFLAKIGVNPSICTKRYKSVVQRGGIRRSPRLYTRTNTKAHIQHLVSRAEENKKDRIMFNSYGKSFRY